MSQFLREVKSRESHTPPDDQARANALKKLEKRRPYKGKREGDRPSFMDRIRIRREKGPKCVAKYVIVRRHDFLHLLRSAPDMLKPEEWALVERRLRAIATRTEEREAEAKALIRAITRSRDADDAMSREMEEILGSDDRVEAAARSPYSISALVEAGLTRAEGREVSDFRRPAVKLTEAADILGVRRGTLDRWCREGVVCPSFTRKSGIHGAGSVNVRYFLPADLGNLNVDILTLRSKAVKGKAVQVVQ